jgi:hypothetical protein
LHYFIDNIAIITHSYAVGEGSEGEQQQEKSGSRKHQ